MSTDSYRMLMARLLEKLPSMTAAERREGYEVRTRQRDGLKSEAAARSHRFFVDEPAEWGTDSAANPAELALASLGASLEVTTRMHAARAGIEPTQISTVLEASLDLGAFLGADGYDGPGFDRVAVRVVLDCDRALDEEALRELQQAVERCCPVLGVFRAPTSVDIRFEATTR